MKLLLSIFILYIPFYSQAQDIDIYTKWTAKIEDNVQLILDLSNPQSIGVTRIKVLDDSNYKIDSFGYKRRFNTFFKDLDSTVIWWSGSLVPLHSSIETEFRLGMIEIVEKNHLGIPKKIKFSGDLPELSIYLEDQDSITFTRMVTTAEEEITYNYFSHYGGEIKYVEYTGEHGGFSMGIRDVGYRFSPVTINRSLAKRISTAVIVEINKKRSEKGVHVLDHDLLLDTVSMNDLNEWITEANKQHRLNIILKISASSKEQASTSVILPTQYNIIQYSTQSGKNATAIQLVDI